MLRLRRLRLLVLAVLVLVSQIPGRTGASARVTPGPTRSGNALPALPINTDSPPASQPAGNPAPPPREGQAQIPYFTGVNLCPYMPEIGPSGKTPFSLPAARKVLAELRTDGIRHVEIVCRGAQDDIDSTRIRPDEHELPRSDLVALVEAALAQGITPILKPHLIVGGSANDRGEIGLDWGADDAAVEAQWFDSYFNFISTYARISAEECLPCLVLATELPSLVADTAETGLRRDQEWRFLAARVRGIFPGLLTYAANSSSVADITWWDAMDYIGLNAYFTLTTDPAPNLETIEKGWVRNTIPNTRRAFHLRGKDPVDIPAQLAAISARFNRPVAFTEIGYRSADYAASDMHDQGYVWLTRSVNQRLQADLLTGMYKTFADKPWFRGAYIWARHAGDEDRSHQRYLRSHDVRGKEAEQVIRRWCLADGRIIGWLPSATAGLLPVDPGQQVELRGAVVSGMAGGDEARISEAGIISIPSVSEGSTNSTESTNSATRHDIQEWLYLVSLYAILLA